MKKIAQKLRFVAALLAIALLGSLSALTATKITGDLIGDNFAQIVRIGDIGGRKGNDLDLRKIDNNVKNLIRELCGNGTVDLVVGEECDPPDKSSCNEDCRYIDNVIPEPVCGNGRLENGEACDRGEDNGHDDSDCTKKCKKKEVKNDSDDDDDDDKKDKKEKEEKKKEEKKDPECLNGIKEDGEECDDGNGDNTDGCTNACKLPHCGDGYKQPSAGEECDYKSDADCTEDCKRPERCGNGKVEGDEECDDGNGDDRDSCTQECLEARCGDGIEQEANHEECDLGAGNGVEGSGCSLMCKKERPKQDDSEKEDDEEHSDKPSIDVPPLPPRGEGNNAEGGPPDRADNNALPSSLDFESDSSHGHDHPHDGDHKHDEEHGHEHDEGHSHEGDILHPSGPDEDEDPYAAMEEIRRKREAMQKQLEESMRRAEEKRLQEEQEEYEQWIEQQEGLSEEGYEEEYMAEEEYEEEPELICFDASGTLTSDRLACDKDQEQYLKPEVDLSEEEAKDEIRKKLLGDDVSEKKRKELLASLQDARTKLHALKEARNAHNSSQEVRDYLQESVDWIDRSIEYFSSGPKTLEEIQQMVEPVSELLSQAAEVVSREQSVIVEQVKIAPIVEKTEKLLTKFRESFIALAHSGVQLDQDALGHYVSAAQKFEEVRDMCTSDETQCGRLNEVLDILKDAQGPLEEALNENPEIYKELQVRFAN